MGIRDEPLRRIREIENAVIPLPDGGHLAARIWLPADAESSPVPALLEYLPYRKRDGTAVRDERRSHLVEICIHGPVAKTRLVRLGEPLVLRINQQHRCLPVVEDIVWAREVRAIGRRQRLSERLHVLRHDTKVAIEKR